MTKNILDSWEEEFDFLLYQYYQNKRGEDEGYHDGLPSEKTKKEIIHFISSLLEAQREMKKEL